MGLRQLSRARMRSPVYTNFEFAAKKVSTKNSCAYWQNWENNKPGLKYFADWNFAFELKFAETKVVEGPRQIQELTDKEETEDEAVADDGDENEESENEVDNN